MELNYDWRTFQSFFFPKRKSTPSAGTQPLLIVQEGNQILSVHSDGEDLSKWLGGPVNEILQELKHRDIVCLERNKIEDWLEQASSLPHFYDQVNLIRHLAKTDSKSRKKNQKSYASPLQSRHFLLETLSGWWNKWLPSQYGIFIRLDGTQGPQFLILVKRGRIDSFHVPDLSQMLPDRRRQASDVVRFLSEHYLVPIQGLFLSSAEWTEWSESPHPWKKIWSTLRTHRHKLVPFKWGIAGMIALKAYLKS